jgi:hypothetical protein
MCILNGIARSMLRGFRTRHHRPISDFRMPVESGRGGMTAFFIPTDPMNRKEGRSVPRLDWHPCFVDSQPSLGKVNGDVQSSAFPGRGAPLV